MFVFNPFPVAAQSQKMQTQQVIEKIQDICVQRKQLQMAIDAEVNKVCVESRHFVDSGKGDENFSLMLTKMDNISLVLNKMKAHLPGAGSEALPSSDKTLLPRIEKLEASSMAVHRQCDSMLPAQSEMLDFLSSQKAQVSSHEKKMEAVLSRLDNLEKNNGMLRKKLDAVDRNSQKIESLNKNLEIGMEDLKAASRTQDESFSSKLEDMEESINTVKCHLQLVSKTKDKEAKAKFKDLDEKWIALEMQLDKMGGRKTQFSAELQRNRKVQKGAMLQHISHVLVNEGNHFNPVSGIFTVPCQGIYCFGLFLKMVSKKSLKMSIIQRYTDDDVRYEKKILNVDETDEDSTVTSDPVKLEPSNEVFIRVTSSDCFAELEDTTCFFGWLVVGDNPA